MQTKNLLHIFNSINHSGAEIMYEAAAPIFIDSGYQLFALSTGKSKGDFVEYFEKAGYTVFFLPYPKEYKLSFYINFFSHFFSFFKLIRNNKIDVLHIHKRHLFWMYALIAKISGIRKIIRTVHNVFNPRFYRYPGYLFARHFSKLIGVKITSISDSVYNNELKRFFNKTIKIYNWYDSNKFYPLLKVDEKLEMRKKLNLNEKDIVLISVGSCINQKRHDLVIKSIKVIKSKINDNIVYLHIGDGPQNQHEQTLAKNEGVLNNVIFYDTSNDIRNLLITSDIFIMPSEYEGIGISALEAMACKIPVILADAPGLRDLIPENSNNGLLVKRNIEDISNAVHYLLNNKKIATVYANNALRFVQEKFNMSKNINEFIRLYEQ